MFSIRNNVVIRSKHRKTFTIINDPVVILSFHNSFAVDFFVDLIVNIVNLRNFILVFAAL